ncbi:MAG: hypothetical protein QOH41_1158 [Blastocatellia bacterium]|nr:hypothetical protein [Blastocatellia bacterium]
MRNQGRALPPTSPKIAPAPAVVRVMLTWTSLSTLPDGAKAVDSTQAVRKNITVRPTTIRITSLNVGFIPTVTSRDRAAGGRLLAIRGLARDYMMRTLFDYFCIAHLGSVFAYYALHRCYLTIWSNVDNGLGERMGKAFENHDSACFPNSQQGSNSYQYGGGCNKTCSHNAPFEALGSEAIPPLPPSADHRVTDTIRCQALSDHLADVTTGGVKPTWILGAFASPRDCGVYRLVLLSEMRGRPGFRFFTAARSLGSMSHSRPAFIAFNRLLSMSARTLFALTPSLRAASVVPMIFMGRKYSTG